MSKFWFTISQSSLKDLERAEGCPYKWKTNWIDRIRSKPSIYMDEGSYFETKCLGSGAIKGQDVTDLPRLKSGEKSSKHKRIDEQVESFNNLINNELKLKIVNSQRVIKCNHELKDGTIVELKGVTDFETVNEHEEDYVVWDLKLTGDVDTTFGPYPWGDLEEFDFTQQIMYKYILERIGEKNLRMGMMVFDTSVRKGVKYFEVFPDEFDKSHLFQRIEAFVKVLNQYKEKGFTKIPSKKECKGCPIKDKCDKAYQEAIEEELT